MSISEISPSAALPPRFHDARHLFAEGHHDEALVVCEQILAARNDCPEAIMLLGLISFELDEPLQAIDLLQRAQEMAPHVSDYTEALAAIQARLGDTTEALFLMKLATTLEPHPSGEKLLPETFMNFFKNVESANPDKFRRRAERLFRSGDHASAEAAAQKQLKLTPGDPQTLRLMAEIWLTSGQKTAAITAQHAVLHGSTPIATDFSALARTLAEAGRHMEAARVDVLARRAAPDDNAIARSALVNLSRDPDRSEEEIAAAKIEWRNRFADVGQVEPETAIYPPLEARPLSVAFIGNRFNDVETVHRLTPVLAALDRRGVRIHIYDDEKEQTIVSEQVNRHARRWTSLRGVDPETAATIIRGDAIDVAIDLGGYGGESRLATFAWRPAPVCLSWCGSALPTAGGFDWMLGGPLNDAETVDRISPAVWQLPDTALVYPAPPGLGDPSPLPALSAGYATLGTAMPLAAIGAATLTLWSDLLAAVPRARLLIANIERLDDECVALAYEQINHTGLRQRVDIVDLDRGLQTDLEFWRHVDVAIDPQPVGSFSRTAQALWMGVPTIAIAGSRFAGRAGAAALLAAGRETWIAPHNAGACERVVSLLSDPAMLGDLRAGLPASVAASPLADGDRLAEALLGAFQDMLQRRA